LGNIGWCQLAIESKRRINEMVKAFPMDMNELSTPRVDFNNIPLGSYDFLIGMQIDWTSIMLS
jgi:hypothetical protein